MKYKLGLQEEIAAATTIREDKDNRTAILQSLKKSLRSCSPLKRMLFSVKSLLVCL